MWRIVQKYSIPKTTFVQVGDFSIIKLIRNLPCRGQDLVICFRNHQSSKLYVSIAPTKNLSRSLVSCQRVIFYQLHLKYVNIPIMLLFSFTCFYCIWWSRHLPCEFYYLMLICLFFKQNMCHITWSVDTIASLGSLLYHVDHRWFYDNFWGIIVLR